MITENDNPPEQPLEDTPDMIDMMDIEELRDSLRQSLSELEHLNSYVGAERIRSDFQTAGDMRAALNLANEELKNLKDRNSIYARLLSPTDACSLELAVSRILSSHNEICNNLKEMTESQKRCFAQWTLEAQNVDELENENSLLKSHVKILRDAITSAYCHSELLVKALNETKDCTLTPIIKASDELKDKMDRLSQRPPISFEKAKAQTQAIHEN